MPSLLNLKLDGLEHNLYFSQLLSLLSRTPALHVLMLPLPTLDLHCVVNVDRSPPRWLPTGPLNVSGTIGPRVKLHNLVSLSLHLVPVSGLWMLLLFVELPVLETLNLHVYTDPHNAYFQGSPSLDAWTVCLPVLCTLHITHCILPAPNCDPATSASHYTMHAHMHPQLCRIIFSTLTDLEITHTLACDPHILDTPRPPLQPLPPLDVLFHALDFTRLTRFALAGCELPPGMLCDVLQTRMPALEALTLKALTLGPACQGKGAFVCALTPGECGAGCAWAPGGDAPKRIMEIQVLECAGVTKDDMDVLTTIPGAQELYWSTPVVG
ncbi:hypothetical protein V8D89_004163 [Ganoderma adspersum]